MNAVKNRIAEHLILDMDAPIEVPHNTTTTNTSTTYNHTYADNSTRMTFTYAPTRINNYNSDMKPVGNILVPLIGGAIFIFLFCHMFPFNLIAAIKLLHLNAFSQFLGTMGL